jgi:hypothetical protein
MKNYKLLTPAVFAFSLLLGFSACKPKNAGSAVSSDAASKTYVAPGKYDEYYNFVSGGFSGQLSTYGLPSGRLLRVIPVFSVDPEKGWGYSEETKPMLNTSHGFVPWDDLHHVQLSKTDGEYILEDLDFAINSGGLTQATMVGNAGRITKGVAQTLLAEVNLTMSGAAVNANRYAEAAQAAREVINSGVYSLVQHTRTGGGELAPEGSAYNKIKDSEQIPSEYIYFYEFDAAIANNGYPALSFPVSVAPLVSYAITNNAYGPTPDLLNSYDAENDLRVQEKQYFHSSIVIDGENVEFNTSPYMWMDESAVFGSAQSSRDIPVSTYADVLLIAAEAIAKSEGVTPEAVDYLAQIRERAYWKQDPQAIRSQLSSLSVDQFVEEVWKERVRELVFEFPIWFDVMRTRKFPQPAEDGSGNIQFVDAVGSVNYFGATVKESTMLFPLPEQELQRNPSLSQNPGYAN